MLKINDIPKDIILDMKTLILDMKSDYDKIANSRDCSFKSIIEQISLISSKNHHKISELTFIKHVSTDIKIRDASMQASKLLQEFSIENSMRLDIFNKIKCVKDSKGYVENKLLKEYHKNSINLGLHLSKEKRMLLKNIRKQIMQLEFDFAKNISEDDTFLMLKPKELHGLPQDYLTRTKIKNLHKITMEYPDYFPIMALCSVDKTRQKVEKTFETRVPQNIDHLSMLLKLRKQEAHTLGFSTYSKYAIKDNMAKSPDKVFNLLSELAEKIQPKVKIEHNILKQIKGDKLESYDYSYYLEIYKKNDFKVDNDTIKEYFPIKYVVKNIFKLYEDLLKLKIKPIILTEKQKWHPELRYYSVQNMSGDILGYFYMDLFSRSGKYSHAAVFYLVNGYLKPDGTYQLPVSALVTNFTKPVKGLPSLLKHSEVTGTFLHELGHIIHSICSSKHKYSYFNGFNVAIDFVETPSQMMENFAFNKNILKRISSHFITKKPLSDILINQIIKSRKVGKAFSWSNTISKGLFDLEIHRSNKNYNKDELIRLYNCFQKGYTILSSDYHRLSTWGHIGGSHYASNYYCYVWSKVIAVDLYTKFNGLD